MACMGKFRCLLGIVFEIIASRLEIRIIIRIRKIKKVDLNLKDNKIIMVIRKITEILPTTKIKDTQPISKQT